MGKAMTLLQTVIRAFARDTATRSPVASAGCHSLAAVGEADAQLDYLVVMRWPSRVNPSTA